MANSQLPLALQLQKGGQQENHEISVPRRAKSSVTR